MPLPSVMNPVVGLAVNLGLVAVFAAVFGIARPRQFSAVVRRLRHTRIIHYAGMAVGGYLLGYRQFYVAEPVSVASVVNAALLGFFSFQSAVFVNDFFDAEGDRVAHHLTPVSAGAISPRTSLALAGATGFMSLVCGFTLAPFAVVFVAGFHLLSVLYSVPPIRIKRFYPLSIFSISLWAWMMMLAGFAVWAGTKTVVLFPPRMTVLVIATITLAFGTKDAKDAAGDRSQGVYTLFTLLGERWGGRVNAALVLASYLVSPLILNYPALYAAAAPLGVLSAGVCLRPRVNENLIFLLYYIFGLSVLGLIVGGRLLVV